MQIFTALTLALATVASATTNSFDSATGQRLNLVNRSIASSSGLYYKGIGLAQISDNIGPLQAVNAQSKPNVAVFGNLDRMDDDYPYITSKFSGQNKTFALTSFYAGCILGNMAGNCVIALAGYKSGVQTASTKLTYTPTGRQSANMVKYTMPTTFQNLDSIRFYTSFTDRSSNPGLGGATFLDDIVYTLST